MEAPARTARLPGFIMPADLTIGFNYFQEHAPNDEAMDQGTIFAFIELSSERSRTYYRYSRRPSSSPTRGNSSITRPASA